jgi:glycosyltransferase involved in cell wall biosynthesis
MKNAKHIALFLSSLGGGGAERVYLDLARKFTERGHRVDMVFASLRGQLVSDIPVSVHTVELGIPPLIKALHALFRLPVETWKVLLPPILAKRPKKLRSLFGLERYLLEERPDAIMATTNIPNLLALWAAWLARVETRLVIRQANSLTTWVNNATKSFQRKLPVMVRHWYSLADEIISVSGGVADDLCRAAAVPRERISVIFNPIDLERIAKWAVKEPDDPWLRPGQPPVLVAVGRLQPIKDYPTMLRAFALARAQQPMKLVILGEGPERRRLEALVQELGVANDVRLLGFQKNPYAYMARAAVFLLSSISEGFPNVLPEALACGCSIVSTNCPDGPAELLDHGRYGQLVPVGDDAALAQAILQTLRAPYDRKLQQKRAEDFSIDAIADQYLEILLGTRTKSARVFQQAR